MNENGKREIEDETMGVQLDGSVVTKDGKKKKIFRKRFKKPKVDKKPEYREGVQPAQILNEAHPSLEYIFDVDTSVVGKARYLCRVTIKNSEGQEQTFNGDGASKKDAKRKCCHFALMSWSLTMIVLMPVRAAASFSVPCAFCGSHA